MLPQDVTQTKFRERENIKKDIIENLNNHTRDKESKNQKTAKEENKNWAIQAIKNMSKEDPKNIPMKD